MAKILDRLGQILEMGEYTEMLKRMAIGQADEKDYSDAREYVEEILAHLPTEERERTLLHTIEGQPLPAIRESAEAKAGAMDPDTRGPILRRLLAALSEVGVNEAALREAGLAQVDADRMGAEDVGVLFGHLARERPEALAAAIARAPEAAGFLGDSARTSVVQHIANLLLGGEPLERPVPERPGQAPLTPHYPGHRPTGERVQEEVTEQTTTGGRKPAIRPGVSERTVHD